MIDTSGPALKAALAQGASIIKPNLAELSDLLEATLDTDKARIAACRKLTRDGHAKIVALTLGEQGALLVTGDRIFRSQPLAIEAVSTVGAGDSFLGGFVAALAAGDAPETLDLPKLFVMPGRFRMGIGRTLLAQWSPSPAAAEPGT